MKKMLIFVAGFIFYPIVIVAIGLWTMRNWTNKEKDIYFNSFDAFLMVVQSIKDGAFR